MRWIGRVLLYVCLGLAGLACLIWAFGPREPVDLIPDFDTSAIGADIDSYLATQEARIPSIRPGAEKHVIWADRAGVETPISLLYIHGFSAAAPEIQPVPEQLAQALGANLVYTRLTGHGRDGAAMTEASVKAWMNDMAEALEIARRVGERVVILSTSTGGTLAALAARDTDLSRDVVGIAFFSPNFAVNSAAARLLTWPAARSWIPYVAGKDRCFEPHNDLHAAHWTTCYPTVALLPMAAVVQTARAADYSNVTIPALFRFSDADRVIRADAVRDVADRWGGPVTLQPVEIGPDDDPYSHVIAGDILSPGQTGPSVQALKNWIEEL